jgi:hypothetical protein
MEYAGGDEGERSAAMVGEIEQAGSDLPADNARQLPSWATGVLLLWFVCALALFAANSWYFPGRMDGLNPSDRAREAGLISAAQFALSAMALVALPILTRFRRRSVSGWMWALLTLYFVWALAYGFDGLAGALPRGTLPTLEQFAPGLISLEPLLDIATTVVVLLTFLTDPATRKRSTAQASRP